MSVVNTVLDRTMRGLVTVRMRHHTNYSATNTAVILVAPQQDLLAGTVSTVVRLVHMARGAGIRLICAPKAQPVADWAVQTRSQRTIADAGLLRAGSPGADIHPALGPLDDGDVLQPFPGLSAFTNTALYATLAGAHLDHVIIAGSRTDIEVDSTARDATEAGLHTTVVSDCCTGSSPDGHRATVQTTLPRLVHAVVTLADLPALLR